MCLILNDKVCEAQRHLYVWVPGYLGTRVRGCTYSCRTTSTGQLRMQEWEGASEAEARV